MYSNPLLCCFSGFSFSTVLAKVQCLLKRGKVACPPLRGRQEKQKLGGGAPDSPRSLFPVMPLIYYVGLSLVGFLESSPCSLKSWL